MGRENTQGSKSVNVVVTDHVKHHESRMFVCGVGGCISKATLNIIITKALSEEMTFKLKPKSEKETGT